jgi:hypothetical protein
MALLVQMLVEAKNRRTRLCASNSAGSNCNSSTGGGKAQAEKTTAMLTIIVAVFLITELPQGRCIFLGF